jgi:hypothetical protein
MVHFPFVNSHSGSVRFDDRDGEPVVFGLEPLRQFMCIQSAACDSQRGIAFCKQMCQGSVCIPSVESGAISPTLYL